MAVNLVVNGVTYNGVDSISIPSDRGAKVKFYSDVETWEFELDDGTTITKQVGAFNLNTYTFTIDGAAYECDAGMTWGEWSFSTYNTGRYSLINNFVVGSGAIVSYDGVSVSANDEIYNGGAYVLIASDEPI